MTSENPKIQYLLGQMNQYAAKGNSAGVAAAADLLQKEMAQGSEDCDDCDCEDCDDYEETLENGLVEMVEEALLEDDKDILIKALSTALMLTAKEAEWIELSSVAHSVWVSQ